MRHLIYGPGGYDPTKPNNNIIEDVEIEDQEQTTETLVQLVDQVASITEILDTLILNELTGGTNV